jgi:hypothetical protein
MIEAKTLLIVGAGASVPYGYPTGYALREELCDRYELGNLKNIGIHSTEIELFCHHFEASQLNSIDAFLAKRGDDRIGNSNGGFNPAYRGFGTYADCGKLAIADQLMRCESIESLIKSKEDHWLQYLWNLMVGDVPTAEFQNNQLKIISFNYDRVIEQYFQTVLENSYGIDYKEASKLRKAIEIVHVYGNLQDLDVRAYGAKPANLTDVAACIRVIPEDREANDVQFEKAKEMIAWADKICFIGFGFDVTNMRRLGFPDHDLAGKKMDSTRYGMHEPEANFAQKLVGTQFCNDVTFNDSYSGAMTLEYIRQTGFFIQ